MSKILFIGEDDTFLDELKQLYSSDLDYMEINMILVKAQNSNQIALEVLSQQAVDLILIDYSTIPFEILRLITFLRSHHSTRLIPIIGLTGEVIEEDFLKQTLLAGINFNYLKGEDNDDLLQNLYYFISDSTLGMKKYATAVEQKIPGQALHLLQVSCLNREELVVNMDFSFQPQEKIEICTNLFDEFKAKHFEVLKSQQNYFNHFLSTLHLKIPYRGPWDEDESIGLTEDTMDTWIELNQATLQKKIIRILIFDLRQDSHPCNNLYDQFPETNIRIEKDFTNLDLIANYFPHLIIVQNNAETDISSKTNEMIQLIKNNIDLKPSILLFNNPELSEVLRENYIYQYLVATTENFDYKLLPNIVTLYFKRKHTDENYFYLPILQSQTVAYYSLDITITSLSENQITFVSDKEIAFFTSFIIELPLKIFVTVMPPTKELSYQHNRKHYMAFIHGFNYAQKKVLRRFVNWLIGFPLAASREEERQSFFEKNKEVEENNKLQTADNKDVETTEKAQQDKKDLNECKPIYKRGKSKF